MEKIAIKIWLMRVSIKPGRMDRGIFMLRGRLYLSTLYRKSFTKIVGSQFFQFSKKIDLNLIIFEV